jgi:hypothetical protein
VLPATTELMGIIDVGIVCATAVANLINTIRVAACIVTITVEAFKTDSMLAGEGI